MNIRVSVYGASDDVNKLDPYIVPYAYDITIRASMVSQFIAYGYNGDMKAAEVQT